MRKTMGLLVLLGLPVIAGAQDDPLVGAIVLPRTPEVELQTVDGAVVAVWQPSPARVTEVKAGRVCVVNIYSPALGSTWTRRDEVVKLADAVAHFNGYIRANPDDAGGYDLRGVAYYELRDSAKAIPDLTEAIRIEATADRHILRGNCYSVLGEHGKSITDYSAALRLKPNDYVALVNRGRARSLSGDHDKAEADLNKAIRLRPADAVGFNERGMMWDKRGEFDRAVADFTEAIRLNKTFPDPFANRGYTEMGRRNYAAAVEDYTRAIRLAPTNGNFRYHRGFAYANLRDNDMALFDFNEAIKLNPSDSRPFFSRADIRRQQREYDQAISDFTESIRLAPKYADAFARRGSTWDAIGEFGKAIADFEEAIRLAPEVQYPYDALGWLRATCPSAKHRDGKKALALAKKVCEMSAGKVADHLDTLAAAHAELGDFDNAIAAEKRALAVPGVGEVAINEYRQRLKLYEDERPFRQPPRPKRAID